jgi:hypothetical protein
MYTYSTSTDNLQPLINKLSSDIEELGRDRDRDNMDRYVELQTMLKLAGTLEKGEPSIMHEVYTWYLDFLQSLEIEFDKITTNNISDSKKRAIKF